MDIVERHRDVNPQEKRGFDNIVDGKSDCPMIVYFIFSITRIVAFERTYLRRGNCLGRTYNRPPSIISNCVELIGKSSSSFLMLSTSSAVIFSSKVRAGTSVGGVSEANVDLSTVVGMSL